MDAFLEDGSHEATIAVVRALVVAVPHTTDRLRDYILNLIKRLKKNSLHFLKIILVNDSLNSFWSLLVMLFCFFDFMHIFCRRFSNLQTRHHMGMM